MEFGLFFLMQRDEAWSEQSVYDSGLAQMLAAESLGYSWCGSPSITSTTTGLPDPSPARVVSLPPAPPRCDSGWA